MDEPTRRDLSFFADLDFEAFRRMASDASLSANEKIGFPDQYRHGYDDAIFADIVAKLGPLRGARGRVVVDIGPGVAMLPRLLQATCAEQDHELILLDSQEVLDQLPQWPGVCKLAGKFPGELRERLASINGRADVVLSYSVLHYAFADGSLFDFFDAAIALLAPQGVCLLGDIPNVSKRKRFFASATGVDFHKRFMNTDQAPEVEFNRLEPRQIDDAILVALMSRARAGGFDAYVVPQGANLPMANRREDLLIVRP